MIVGAAGAHEGTPSWMVARRCARRCIAQWGGREVSCVEGRRAKRGGGGKQRRVHLKMSNSLSRQANEGIRDGGASSGDARHLYKYKEELHTLSWE